MTSISKLNLFQPKENKEHSRRVEGWIREFLSVSQSQDKNELVNIIVTEVQCNDPNCVPIETLVVIIGSEESGSKFSDKITKPLSEVKQTDVQELMIAWEYKKILSSGVGTLVASTKELIHSHLSGLSVLDRIAYLSEIEEFVFNELKIYDYNNSSVADMDDLPPLIDSIESQPQIKKSESDLVSPPVPISLPESSISKPSTLVSMKPIASVAPSSQTAQGQGSRIVIQQRGLPPVRHEKGTRGPKGCPCCDPDNIENLADRILFLDCPP